MGNLLYRISLKFVLTTIGILLVGSLPSLFNKIYLDFPHYLSTMKSLITDIFHPQSFVYVIFGVARPLFPKIWYSWQYSMTLLFISFFIAFVIALILTYYTMRLPKKARSKIKFVVFTLQSIPDILIIALFLIGVVWLYTHTHILFLNVATYGSDKAYTLPIIVLFILPSLLLYQTMIHCFEDEENEPYVELARSKGLKERYVLITHILRNALISISQNAQFILSFMLSNLLLVEYIFNIHGILYFMLVHYSSQVLTVGLFLTFCPLYLLLSIGQFIIERSTAKEIGM